MLILSSCDFRNEASRAVILQHLPKPIEHCRVLFVPNEIATRRDVRGKKYHKRLALLGFSRENIHVLDRYRPELCTDLDIDLLYIGGGNTFRMLQRLRDCGFDREIARYVRAGVLYVGGSAGAYIVSKDISHVVHFDDCPEDFTDFTALGLFDGVLICHYTEDRHNILEQLQADSPYPVTALTDEDSLLISTKNIV